MALWYSLVDLLPFDWAQPGSMFFMKNALLAVLVISPLFGLLSTMVVAINQFDLVTTFTAVASCLNNIGPGLELVGPMVSFADFSPLIKLVLSFDMLVGRLEIFPMLVLFAPSTWLRSKGHLDRRLRARNLF